MKKILFLVSLSLCYFFVNDLGATNPISVEWHEKELALEKENAKLSTITKVKKWVKKRITGAYSEKTLKTMGTIALILGILSILGWVAIGAAGTGLLWLMAIFAIAGDVLSIMTLWNTRNDKKAFRGTRIKAWIGLILSLLTGILPILLLILVLASL